MLSPIGGHLGRRRLRDQGVGLTVPRQSREYVARPVYLVTHVERQVWQNKRRYRRSGPVHVMGVETNRCAGRLHTTCAAVSCMVCGKHALMF